MVVQVVDLLGAVGATKFLFQKLETRLRVLSAQSALPSRVEAI